MYRGSKARIEIRQGRREKYKPEVYVVPAAGITSVSDAGVSKDFGIAYQDAYHAGEMRFRDVLRIDGRAKGRIVSDNTLIIGEAELSSGVAPLKEMATGIQTETALESQAIATKLKN